MAEVADEHEKGGASAFILPALKSLLVPVIGKQVDGTALEAVNLALGAKSLDARSQGSRGVDVLKNSEVDGKASDGVGGSRRADPG